MASVGPGAAKAKNPRFRNPSTMITATPFSTAPICKYIAFAAGFAKTGASGAAGFSATGSGRGKSGFTMVASATGAGAGATAACTLTIVFGASALPARYETAENTTTSTTATNR